MQRGELALIWMSLLAIVLLAIVLPSLFYRYKKQRLRHEERMASLEKGIEIPMDAPGPAPAIAPPRVYLLRGLLWLFTGFALTVFMLGVSVLAGGPESPESKLLRANRRRDMGASEAQIEAVFTEDVQRDGPNIGLAFVGFIPMSVGLAYLVFYRSENQRLSENLGPEDVSTPL